MAPLKNEDALGEEAGGLVASLTRRAIVFTAIFFTLLLGVFNVLESLDVHMRGRAFFMQRYLSITSNRATDVILLLFGSFIIYLAYQLWLRKKAAVLLLSAIFATRAVIGIALGRNVSLALLYLLFGIALVSVAREFPVLPDPAFLRKFRIALPLVLGAYFSVSTATLYFLKGELPAPANPQSLVSRTAMAAIGENASLNFHGGWVIVGALLTLASILGLIYLASLLLRPHRGALDRSQEEHQQAQRLVESYGSDSLAYFALREDKKLFFHSDSIFLAYRCINGVALISGDPVGPPELTPVIMKEFKAYCFERGWRVASLGAREEYIPVYEQLDLKPMCVGEEALIKVQDFSLEGRRVKTLRHSVNKLSKMGITMDYQFNAGIPAHLRHELSQLSSEWRDGVKETGFSMGLGRLMHSEDENCLLAIAYDADGRAIGFLYMVPMYPHVGYSLDIARTAVGSTNGLVEFMIARTALFLKERGYRNMSLHFCFFSQHYREDREEPGSSLARTLARALSKYGMPIISLYNFDRKFRPDWNKRYAVYESIIDMPHVALSALKAESSISVAKHYKN